MTTAALPDTHPPTTAPAPRGWWTRNQLRLAPWLFLAPGMIFFAIYVIVPIFQSFNISLYEWNGLDRPDGTSTAVYVGLENYRDLWTDPFFWTSLKNNVIWLILYLLAIPAGLAIALFLNQTVRGIRLYKSLFFFPFVISQVVVGLVFSWMYLPNDGIVDQIYFGVSGGLSDAIGWLVGLVGIEPQAAWLQADWQPTSLRILGNADIATYGIIAAGLWPQTAYCMILYLTGLNAVDPEQVEAGRLDGAKGLRMLWFVILPQLRPATFIAFVVTIIGALRSFDLIAIMTDGGPGFYSTSVLAFYMFDVALSEFGFRMGYGSAIAVVLFLIMLVYIAFFLWKMWRDERGT